MKPNSPTGFGTGIFHGGQTVMYESKFESLQQFRIPVCRCGRDRIVRIAVNTAQKELLMNFHFFRKRLNYPRGFLHNVLTSNNPQPGELLNSNGAIVLNGLYRYCSPTWSLKKRKNAFIFQTPFEFASIIFWYACLYSISLYPWRCNA
jgi:hypothetical protein